MLVLNFHCLHEHHSAQWACAFVLITQPLFQPVTYFCLIKNKSFQISFQMNFYQRIKFPAKRGGVLC